MSTAAQPTLTVALVDDDLHVRLAVARLLRSHGLHVEAFDSAEAYLSARCDPHCAIVDIELPGLSGVGLEAVLRQDGCRTPVIFMTACDDQATRIGARPGGPTCLRKPIDGARLLEAVKHATAGG